MAWTILAFAGCCVLVFILHGLGELRAKTEKPEMYVTKYPTKWDWKLEELGIKEEWDREREKTLLENDLDADTPPPVAEDFKMFIRLSFPWFSSSKGYLFWHEISRK